MRYLALAMLLISGCKLEPANTPAPPERSQAAKVAAVMAANDITLPQVVAYLYANGWTVVPAPLPSAHWTAAAPGDAPVAYYLWEMTGAVGDTAMTFYLPQTAGAVALRVRAVDTDGLQGREWSEVGVSAGGPLPGVVE